MTNQAFIPGETFGSRLHLLRHEKRISSDKMAEICGVTGNAVLAWERGSSPKNMAEIVMKIVEATGVDRDWLLWGETSRYEKDLEKAFSRDAGIPTINNSEVSYKDPYLVEEVA